MGFPVEGKVLGTPVTGSLADAVLHLRERQTNAATVYPSLTDGASVVSANSDWTMGAYATVIPASTIGTAFQLTAVNIESCDKNAVFELELYQGDGDTRITTVRFAVIGGFFGNCVYRFSSAEIAANARVRARLASSDGLANQATITISVRYIVYT